MADKAKKESKVKLKDLTRQEKELSKAEKQKVKGSYVFDQTSGALVTSKS